ncbi:MAG: hypothetical protein JW852_06435 [Spirochaetales bacterium]|nr:hypothetical protein [Spirochaetales bacterium]
MRKAACILALLLIFVSAPVFSGEIELGLSWTPIADDSVSAEEDRDAIRGFHIGYVLWNFVYFSWDALVMPPSIIEGWTGYYRPGFLNMYDAGIRFYLKPFLLYSELGMNNVYVYNQGSSQALSNNFGANLRLGAGLKWDWIGVNISGTAVFHSFSSMTGTLAELTNEDSRDRALEKIRKSLVPSFNLALYF